MEDRTKLLETLSQREREIRALNEQQQKVLNERARLIEDLQRRNRESSALLAVAQGVSGSLDPGEVAQAALDKLKESLDIECGFIHLFDEEGLVLKASHGFVPELKRELATLDPQASLVGQILESTQPVSIEDIAANPLPPLTPLLKLGYNSYVGVRLRAGEESLGILSLSSRFKQAFRPEDVGLLAGVGGQVAMALQNCRLYRKVAGEEEELRFVTQLESIVTSSLDLSQAYDDFVRELRKYMSVEWGGVVLIEGDKVRLGAVSSLVKPLWQEGQVVPLRGTAAEWVAQNKRSLVEEDLAEKQMFWTGKRHLEAGIRSIVYLPLILGGECFGSLILGSQQPRAYGPKEVKLLERLAVQLAPIIENDLLYQEVGQALQKERRAKEELSRAADEMVELAVYIAGVLEPASRQHAERVAGLCSLLGKKLGLPQEEIKKLERAAELHNLGLTFFVPREIVQKRPEARTPEEQEVYKSHIARWCALLSRIPQLRELVPYIEAHHERYNGSGYPKGLKGDQMPLEAHILIVAHAFDAMTELPSGQGLGREEALERLRKEAGIKWHPRVVEALLQLSPEALD